MPLVDVLYRCPLCGSESMSGEDRRAECRDCGASFQHAGRGGLIRLSTRSGERPREVPVAELLDGRGARGAANLPPETPPPRVSLEEEIHEAAVLARFARREEAMRYRGWLLGFVEQFEEPRAGHLRLDARILQFTGDAGAISRWPLRDIRAVQTSSSAVQVSPLAGGVVSFHFLEADSPRRWEDLLKVRLRDTWRREGRGEIVEFQPRIRST